MQKEEIYRDYVTDSLKHIVNNTAGQESRTLLKTRFHDIIAPAPKAEDSKKAEDIIDNIKNKLKGG